MHQIVRREEMANGNVILNEIEAPYIARKAKPGQFVILKADERGERIPLTMADTDRRARDHNRDLQSRRKVHGALQELEGGRPLPGRRRPLLGQPTHLEKVGTVACVGGGTGIAVLYPITRGWKRAGNRVISIIGARTADRLFLEEEMRAVSDELFVCTDDGSRGHHGFVTEILKKVLEEETLSLVVAVGPVLMMKLISEMTRPRGVKTIVSPTPS